jgi:hypothetical protein
MGPSRHTAKEASVSDTASATPALTTREALMAYAAMINTGDPSALAPLLAPDVTYTSQNVLTDMVGKDAYLEFMAAKFETMRNAGLMPMADLAHRPGYGHVECAVLWQGNPPVPQCLVYADVVGEHLKAIHLCIVPAPESAKLLGLWPGLPEDQRPTPPNRGASE